MLLTCCRLQPDWLYKAHTSAGTSHSHRLMRPTAASVQGLTTLLITHHISSISRTGTGLVGWCVRLLLVLCSWALGCCLLLLV